MNRLRKEYPPATETIRMPIYDLVLVQGSAATAANRSDHIIPLPDARAKDFGIPFTGFVCPVVSLYGSLNLIQAMFDHVKHLHCFSYLPLDQPR